MCRRTGGKRLAAGELGAVGTIGLFGKPDAATSETVVVTGKPSEFDTSWLVALLFGQHLVATFPASVDNVRSQLTLSLIHALRSRFVHAQSLDPLPPPAARCTCPGR